MQKFDIKLDIEQKSINQAKGLIMDMVRGANSGHTGGPFSSLDFTYVLYKEFLKFDPDSPHWFNRDRFVLSAGHESALLYAIIYYIGWISIEDLKQFRQMGSRTPGHPERGVTPGVESTTGPLGQGVGNAVGMAVSEAILRNQLGTDINNHFTYFLHSDGDIQEPVAMGSVAIAGHWGLGKLIGYYDANEAQISGTVSRADSADYVKFYQSNNWHVQEVDGQNRDEIRNAIRLAQMEVEKPSIIIGRNVIAPGCATMEGDHNTHGAPLPPEEIAKTKIKLGLDPNKFYHISEDVLSDFRESFAYAREEIKAWEIVLNKKMQEPSFKEDWEICINNKMPDIEWPQFKTGDVIATRKVWGAVIEAMAPKIKTLVGGSADLEPSNVTAGFASMVKDFSKGNHSGRNFAYGVREFPMGAINNGIAQHGGLKVFGATFFVFSDYERPAIRMRALQKLPVITEYTHDSIFVGEDGPTHQPIEQLMACRAIPNLLVLRPCDANEAVVASKLAFEQLEFPSLILLTRQGLPVLDRNIYPSAEEFRKGAYVISNYNEKENPKISIFSSGSEVSLALDVKEALKNQFNIRVVNFGCWKLFDMQPKDYRLNIIHDPSFKVSVEAGITQGWQKYTGNRALNIGIDRFGESAPGKEVAEHLGLSVSSIKEKIIKAYHKSIS